METEAVLNQGEQRKKEPSKRTAARKAPSTFTEISDGDDVEDNMPTILEEDEEDLELVEASKGGKAIRRKPANGKAKGKKATTTITNMRGVAQSKPVLSQKLITEVLKPAKNAGISPEKKVRKMRASPFNKKSGSVLGRAGSSPTDSEESSTHSSKSPAEMNEIPVVAARPKRGNMMRFLYVKSDSEVEDELESDDSDFEEEED